MYEQVTFLKFDDCEQFAVLGDCDDLLPLIRSIMPLWPVRPVEVGEDLPVPFLEIGLVDGKYLLMTEAADMPVWFDDPVDAVCAAIVELAWETLRTNPDWLCLHCAAIETSGRLLIFPAIYRSGKSTISACMARLGHRIFTDDFLALETQQSGLYGLASGVGIRMRKPWPEQISNEMKGLLEKSLTAQSKRYSYHFGSFGELAPRGARAKPGAFIILDRMDEGQVELETASPADVLKTLVTQNFSRSVNAQFILKALHWLATTIPSYKLRYSDPEQAALLLSDRFQNWEQETAAPLSMQVPGPIPSLTRPRNTFGNISETSSFTKCRTVAEHDIDGVQFLADGDGYGVFRLDEISSAIWRLLDEPARVGEIVDTLHAAFPDKQKAEIYDDIVSLFKGMLEAGLVSMQNIPSPEIVATPEANVEKSAK